VASVLLADWLSHVDDNTLKRAVASIRGVVTVNADLRPEASPDYEHQGLILFLAELLDESSTRSLLSLSQEKQIRSNDFALVGVQEGRLFSLVIARSFIEGRASFENQASMRRFSTPIAEVLRRLA